VFSDKTKMTQLTSIVWPEIWRLAHQKIVDAWDQGTVLICLISVDLLDQGTRCVLSMLLYCWKQNGTSTHMKFGPL